MCGWFRPPKPIASSQSFLPHPVRPRGDLCETDCQGGRDTQLGMMDLRKEGRQKVGGGGVRRTCIDDTSSSIS